MDEPEFMLRASDPAAPFALLAYASISANKGANPVYVAQMKELAQEFYAWQDIHGIIPAGRAAYIGDKIDQLKFGQRMRGFDTEGTLDEPPVQH